MSHSIENCSYLYCSEQVRELERGYLDKTGIASFALMRRAGQAAFKILRQHWPDANRIRIYCGPGNNGGDGYIVAVEAKKAGMQVELVSTVDTAQLKGDAEAACQLAKEWGLKIIDLSESQEKKQDKNNPAPDLIVDALLGIGLGGDVRGTVADAIAEINQTNCPVLAIDIPSGVCSDTGWILGDAVRADATVTFVGVKQGLLSGRGPGCVGELYFESIGISVDELPSIPGLTEHLAKADLIKALPPRSRDAHKGDFGHLLMVGGNYGMAGAITLSTEAALRSGCGLLSIATQPEHLPGLQARLPEAMAHGVTAVAELEAMLEKATCAAIGPGLGATQWSEHMLKRTLSSDLDLVLDADALNLLSSGVVETADLQTRLQTQKKQWILTPHPGEAARLLSASVQQVEADRWAAVKALQKKYSAVVVLKGAGSLICHWDAEREEQRVALCSAGNPGMASGGMGDVLTGVIAGLLAQGLEAHEAARMGVLVHALSADQAAIDGERGMVATDLMPFIRQQVNS
ncbi:MAG: NAD(P)H-hydrate dehydratase [Pseudomonadales bacterium]|nr:NAD(P)H-hydrate dehydratase [Pseudomonadales bacterium]